MNFQATPPKPAIIEYGVSILPYAGESESGDQCLIRQGRSDALIAVADGAGHGPEAAHAARLALAAIDGWFKQDVAGLMRRCHQLLRKTRGVVMGVARLDGITGALTWLGVGNVTGVVIRRNARYARPEPLLVRPGVVGYRLPPLKPSVAHMESADLLVLATDGIAEGYADQLMGESFASARPEWIAKWISRRYSKPSDDGLVVVARYAPFAR